MFFVLFEAKIIYSSCNTDSDNRIGTYFLQPTGITPTVNMDPKCECDSSCIIRKYFKIVEDE